MTESSDSKTPAKSHLQHCTQAQDTSGVIVEERLSKLSTAVVSSDDTSNNSTDVDGNWNGFTTLQSRVLWEFISGTLLADCDSPDPDEQPISWLFGMQGRQD
ncbi:hypothetical protein WG66_010659 [Moniliophthora roreri]|nr:hypothetical protein WG66_010659 [Moniliophthora roreri]